MRAAGQARPARRGRPGAAGQARPRRASHAREPAVAIGRLSLLNREQLPA